MDDSATLPETPARHDGWTRARARTFLEVLARSANVATAAKAAGVARDSCYALRRRDAVFADAWRAALTLGTERLADALFERAVDGEAWPVFFKGEQVGERIRYYNRLAMFLLRTHDPGRYGRQVEVLGMHEADSLEAAARKLKIDHAVLDLRHY